MKISNKRNIHFFESTSMKGLYQTLDEWQVQNEKRFLSLNIEKDGEDFTCIALTNPSEVILTNEDGKPLGISDHNALVVYKTDIY